ncbi:MAG: hypothetical protein OEX07_02415 [Gammaproteobacteria bacterium]|nr:hypothetical protein [Gammaproteobacteria bacterium]
MTIKKYISGLVFICSLSSYGNAFAEVESWYTYWSAGVSRTTYPAEAELIIQQIENTPGVDRTQVAVDVFGFYWPINNNQIAGFVMHGNGDTFKDANTELSYTHALYSLSTMRFFGKEIGQGLFLRGDAGGAKILARLKTTGIEEELESDWGVGVLGAVGYGFPMSSESRLLLSVEFSQRKIERETFKSTAFVVSGLW